MIIVISPEYPTDEETFWVNRLLEHGLEYFHVRKYAYSEEEQKGYLESILPKYRNRLVLHSHYHFAKDFGIDKLHCSDHNRKKLRPMEHIEKMHSTSTHSITDFNQLSSQWAYAFFSPIYPSVSKIGYGQGSTVFSDIKSRTNAKVKLIGLGGIDDANYQQVFDEGADGIALLGSVWLSKNPLDYFLKCQKINP